MGANRKHTGAAAQRQAIEQQPTVGLDLFCTSE
jgi:hypothetical protein